MGAHISVAGQRQHIPTGSRTAGKVVWALLVLLLFAVPVVGSHNWVDLPDVGGLDDAVAQSDLTTMGFDGSHPGTFSVRWSWDKITFSGANTGDACMLFDTNGDTNIDNSLCVQIATSGVTTSIVSGFPVLFTCGNARTDRCSTPTPTGLGGTTCTVGQVTTDPFAGGESYPDDMQAECAVPISALTGTPIFTTVCSYPSAGNGGNNNPVDCVGSPGSIIADVQVTKSNGSSNVLVGGSTTYTIAVSNPGPNNAHTSTVTDPAVAGLTKTAVSCAASGGAVCPASLTIAQLEAGVTIPTLPLNGLLTITVDASVTAVSGSVTNTATVAVPAGAIDPNTVNDNASDTDTVTAPSATADLQITKTDGAATIAAGAAITYTITASNAGPDPVTAATVADTVPGVITGVTWTCSATAGSSCPAGGSGDISAAVDLLAGGSATFSVTGTVSAAAAGTLANTAAILAPAGVLDPTPGNNSATDANTVTTTADLAITKTDGASSSAAGGTVTYTVTASNAGPGGAVGATVGDTLPASLSGATWTCVGAGGGVCVASGTGNVATAVDLPAGASTTFTITATLNASATGTLTNTATIAAPAGVTDPTPANNSATDTNTISSTADLTMTKTDGAASVVAGSSTVYTLVASNAGPSSVTGATVTDTLPAALSGATWTCTATAGSACPASGSGNLNATVTLLPGGSATFVLSATLSGSASGTLANTASVSAPGGTTDPNPANNSATDTSSVTAAPLTADLSITKTSAPDPYLAGAPLTYTIVAANAGPAAATNARVQDTLPAPLAAFTWTCSASGGGSCATASGSGNIDALVTLPAGTSVTFTLTGIVPGATTGPLSNTASVTPPVGVTDPTPGNQSATNVNTPLASLAPSGAELELRQTFPTAATPGGLLTYTYTTTNRGPGIAQNLVIDGMLPAGTTFESAAPGAGGTTSIVGGMFVATWAGPTPPGASRTVTVLLRVNPSAAPGSIVGSWFMTSSAGSDPYHFNDMVDSYVFVGGAATADLVLTGSADTGTDRGAAIPVAAGTLATLHLTVANAGGTPARGAYALILDEVGAFDVVEARASHGSLGISSAHSAVWDTGSIAAASTASLDLVVRMVSTASTRLLVMRTDGAPADPDATNDFVELTLDGLPAAPRGGRAVATGRLDQVAGREMIVGGGDGESPQLRLFTGAGQALGQPYYAYDRSFRGGVRLTACDVDGDGDDEIITGQGPGGSLVRVIAYTAGVYSDVVSFRPFESGFTGGVFVSCADLDANGRAELVVGAGAGRAADVRVFSISGASATQTAAFAAYEPAFTGGVRVAAAVFAGGAVPAFHLVTSPGPGRATDVRAWRLSGASAVRVAEAALGGNDGATLTLGDADNDGRLDLVVTPDGGVPMQALLYGVGAGRPIATVAPGNLRPDGGIRIAIGDLGAGGQDIVVGEGAGGRPSLTVYRLTMGGATLRGGFLALEVP